MVPGFARSLVQKIRYIHNHPTLVNHHHVTAMDIVGKESSTASIVQGVVNILNDLLRDGDTFMEAVI